MGQGVRLIQGLGVGFVPETLNTQIYDEVIQVTNEESMEASRKIAKEEGILVGISSGAAIHAAAITASRCEYKGRVMVVILPDSGERYLSISLFQGQE